MVSWGMSDHNTVLRERVLKRCKILVVYYEASYWNMIMLGTSVFSRRKTHDQMGLCQTGKLLLEEDRIMTKSYFKLPFLLSFLRLSNAFLQKVPPFQAVKNPWGDCIPFWHHNHFRDVSCFQGGLNICYLKKKQK